MAFIHYCNLPWSTIVIFAVFVGEIVYNIILKFSRTRWRILLLYHISFIIMDFRYLYIINLLLCTRIIWNEPTCYPPPGFFGKRPRTNDLKIIIYHRSIRLICKKTTRSKRRRRKTIIALYIPIYTNNTVSCDVELSDRGV